IPLRSIPVYSTTPHPLTVDSGQDSSQAAVLLLALKVKLLKWGWSPPGWGTDQTLITATYAKRTFQTEGTE
ncbi:MAG: hypothetical protein LBK66_14755, partial [Spirochaetaceae bacterium]|nr:hypothetical protein [Spirochaetaceae bacterium]